MDENKILVVDDDEMSYNLISAAIDKEYQVVYRASGAARYGRGTMQCRLCG